MQFQGNLFKIGRGQPSTITVRLMTIAQGVDGMSNRNVEAGLIRYD